MVLIKPSLWNVIKSCYVKPDSSSAHDLSLTVPQMMTTGSLTPTMITTPSTTPAESLMRMEPAWTVIPSSSPDILTASDLKTRRMWQRRNRRSASWANTDAFHTLVRWLSLTNDYCLDSKCADVFLLFLIMQVSVTLPKGTLHKELLRM